MRTLLSMSQCPNCGAPLSVEPDRRSVICIFCNACLQVTPPTAQASGPRAPETPPVLTSVEVPAAEIERVKQLLIDGKRDEAIAHYAQIASVSQAEAERAVENVFLSAYWTLTRHLPINAFGFLLYGVLIALGAGPAAWAARGVGDSPALYAVVALGSMWTVYQIYRFGQHLGSTVVASFGARGRGRVVRRAIVRDFEGRGVLVVVVFEVVPDDGSAPFVDQETLLVGSQSVEKLAPGNIVRVRFDGARRHVFPDRPMTVVGTA